MPLRVRSASQPSAPPFACPQESVGVPVGPPPSQHTAWSAFSILAFSVGVSGQLMVVLRCMFPMPAFPFLFLLHKHTSSMQAPRTAPFVDKSSALGDSTFAVSSGGSALSAPL